MRAVYESTQPYLQVGYWDVNATVPVYCEAKEDKKGYIVNPQKVGVMVRLPDSLTEQARVYTFSEGSAHNQLTLTDPREILNMRSFISCRDQIREIYCEGDPVEELSKQVEDEELEDLSEEFEEDFEEYEDDSYSEWDEQMARRLDS